MTVKEFVEITIVISVLAFCIFYFTIGSNLFESWHIKDMTRDKIVVENNYRIDDIFVVEYSDGWWYVSIDIINMSDGATSYNILKYNSFENRFVYNELHHIKLR
jgi:hypothetical protein